MYIYIYVYIYVYTYVYTYIYHRAICFAGGAHTRAMLAREPTQQPAPAFSDPRVVARCQRLGKGGCLQALSSGEKDGSGGPESGADVSKVITMPVFERGSAS